MRLTAVQLPAKFGAMADQLRATEAILEGGPKTDLILFNEAAFTGYVSIKGDFSLTHLAEPLIGGKAHEALTHFARRFDALVVGPVIEQADGRCFNSLLAVKPDGGTLFHYRKRHPWMPETWATAGDTPFPLVEWRGKKLTAAICFDVHFLAETAERELTAADVLLFSSAWVDDDSGDSRPGHFASLRLPVLNANWGVGRPKLPGQGGSMFVSRSGEIVKRLEGAAARLDVELA
ncbi:MAG: carbon-nitrogen hydrolase family protein [Archangium sp.]|nr:carbon-nitrogen hydrolase family protein [Archangium sp.]